ncbi:hypothetical protein ACIQWV_39450 [Streptomyces sp. NPDC098085]|uniref:hypothetical protein n=1 Tax=Streptomyces sp. NPDC098085 TaxID=3366094 RepID=UPI00382FE97F
MAYHSPEFETYSDEPDGSLPPILRRPDSVPSPVTVTELRSIRKGLLANPRAALDDEAASTITSGAVDPNVLGALTAVHGSDDPAVNVNLLVPKPVVNGTLYVTAPHQRFTDLGLLPDFTNQRWLHQQRTAMDIVPPVTATTTYSTHHAVIDGERRPLAILEVRMRDRAALAKAVTESMRQTISTQKGANNYTDSVLQQGVKEPVMLFVVRVVYDDRTAESYLVAGDGNSRLVSMWLARTGGDIDTAAAACVKTVIGPVGRGYRKAADHRAARREVGLMADRVRQGLAEPVLTEETRREGHTLTLPAVVVVGACAKDDGPLDDLVTARDDLLASIHIHVTPWTDAAQHTQGMQRVYRRAAAANIVSAATSRVLSGDVGTAEMHKLLGVPAHRLWSAAVHQHAVLAGTAESMNGLIRTEFGRRKIDRQWLSERLATVALSAYRSQEGLEHVLRAFGNGGNITDTVWKTSWTLTAGADPQAVLEEVLERAVKGEQSAIAELTVLGGTAAMLAGLITRDRGSKLGVERNDRTAPFRATPNSLLTKLSRTVGGLGMLHSIALAHVASDASVRPKMFHTRTHEVDGILVQDGDQVTDRAGAQVTLVYEWDLVFAADRKLAEETITSTKQSTSQSGGKEDSNTGEAEDVRLRRLLDTSVTSAMKAAQGLKSLVATQGRDAFGSAEGVDALTGRLDKITKILIRFAPEPAVTVSFDDEDDE